MVDFRLKLKKILKERGVSQMQLCKEIEMTEQGFINSSKNDNLTICKLEHICKYLNVPMSYFLEIEEKPVGYWKKLIEDISRESNDWRMRCYQLEEKISTNFHTLSRYVNPFFA